MIIINKISCNPETFEGQVWMVYVNENYTLATGERVCFARSNRVNYKQLGCRDNWYRINKPSKYAAKKIKYIQKNT